MRVLFIISSSDTAFWLSEVTHPYWHLTERGVDIDFASPLGGKVTYDPYSDPYFERSTEADDLVSKGFLSDKELVARLELTAKLSDVDLTPYDAVHVAGGRGADLRSLSQQGRQKALNYFWEKDKVVGAICMARSRLGISLTLSAAAERRAIPWRSDKALQQMFGSGFLIPHYPQTVLEEAGSTYSRVGANDHYVIRDGKLVTGQNQQSASEYGLTFLHAMTDSTPVL